MARPSPGAGTAVKRLSIGASLAQQCDRPLTELVAIAADDNDITPAKVGGPIDDIVHLPAKRAGDQSRIGSKILIRSHINDRRRLFGADEASKLVDRYHIDCR